MATGGATTYGTLTSAPDGGIVKHIYSYVATQLNEFSAAVESGDSMNENELTDKFVRVLEQVPAECPYRFHHQNQEDGKKGTSTDFAAYPLGENAKEILKATALVKFEAKRLNSNLPAGREREYVIGKYTDGNRESNSGGIERFKNGRHGADVICASIIGYLQSDTFDIWLERITGWIQDEINSPHDSRLTWEESDKLQATSQTSKVISYHSSSTRLDNGPITLRHLWVNLCPD